MKIFLTRKKVADICQDVYRSWVDSYAHKIGSKEKPKIGNFYVEESYDICDPCFIYVAFDQLGTDIKYRNEAEYFRVITITNDSIEFRYDTSLFGKFPEELVQQMFMQLVTVNNELKYMHEKELQL